MSVVGSNPWPRGINMRSSRATILHCSKDSDIDDVRCKNISMLSNIDHRCSSQGLLIFLQYRIEHFAAFSARGAVSTPVGGVRLHESLIERNSHASSINSAGRVTHSPTSG